MLTVGFSHMAFMTLRDFHSIPSLLSVFIMKGCSILSNAFFFFASVEMIIQVFRHLIIVLYYID